MDVQAIKTKLCTSPAFVLDEAEITRSLRIMDSLRDQCGIKVLYSIKSLPVSTVLELAKPWVNGFSVSSLFEARIAQDILAGSGSIHLTTPGIRFDELDTLLATASHLSFNSLNQLQRFIQQGRLPSASIGIRVNPKLSYLDDDRYNPCRPHSKLGVSIDDLWQSSALDQVKGLHIHTLFAAEDYQPLIKTIEKIRAYFGSHLKGVDWINLGGGYLFNHIKDHLPFIDLVSKLKADFGLEVYVEPGKAIVGDAGYLLSTVIDSFVSDGQSIAILDTSVNHQPEVFEYGFQPELHEHDPNGRFNVTLAGSTCLAGDLFGEYRFKEPLMIGDKVVFKKIGAYSLVKANRFNGFNLPDIYWQQSGQLTQLKHYSYQDYRQQWLVEK